MPGEPPHPTPIFRLIHVDTLAGCLQRGGLFAPNHTPADGLVHRPIHRQDIQGARRVVAIPCGPRGTAHDYVPFYFGYRSVMLLQLKTGQVEGYAGGQEPLIYLASSCEAVVAAGAAFVFSDGHGLAKYTAWYDDLANLERVDWGMVYQQYWADAPDDMDRQRRKQAEFLVYRFCPWTAIQTIGVVSDAAKARVESDLRQVGAELSKPVLVRRDWYYP